MPVQGLAVPIPVAAVSVSTTGIPGDLIATRDDIQYGGLLLPATVGSELTGWRDTPDTSVSDTPFPQAHGSAPGEILGEALTVTLTYRLLNPPVVTEDERDAMVNLIERNLRLDSVERPLVVNDGDLTMRMGRVLQRHVPRGWNYRFDKKLECSVQWLCADPRRYDLVPTQVTVGLPMSSGGLAYPVTYPAAYGTSSGGAQRVSNDGSTATAPQIVFQGPLTHPVLICDSGWRLGFGLTLAAGDSLVVDTAAGTVLLNGVDRLYTIDTTSDPLERCQIPVGVSNLVLTATDGTGQAVVTYRDAYL